MPPYQPIPAQQSLALAIALEDDHIRRLRQWSLRFKPYDADVGRVLDQLLREAEGHRGELLYHASRHLDWKQRPRPQREDPADPEHFFILSGRSALAVLEAAVRLGEEAKRFYRYCSVLEPTGSLLGGLYKNLGTFKDVQVQLLSDLLDRIRLREAPMRTPGPYLNCRL